MAILELERDLKKYTQIKELPLEKVHVSSDKYLGHLISKLIASQKQNYLVNDNIASRITIYATNINGENSSLNGRRLSRLIRKLEQKNNRTDSVNQFIKTINKERRC